MALKNELAKQSKLIAELIKKEIKRQGLVETGALFSSIKPKIKVQDTAFTVEIEAQDYYKYLDGRYNITENALNGPAFVKISENIAFAIAEEAVNDMVDDFNKKEKQRTR